MYGEDPWLHDARFARDGRRLIAEGRATVSSPSATDRDGAHEILRLVAYALIPDGEVDLDGLFADALEAARQDYGVIQSMMAMREEGR